MKSKRDCTIAAAEVADSTYMAGWHGAISHLSRGGVGKNALALLNRFAGVYAAVPMSEAGGEVRQLWRDFYEFTGVHMILTDEGWEPGNGKQAYVDQAASNGDLISEYILDEVNSPE